MRIWPPEKIHEESMGHLHRQVLLQIKYGGYWGRVLMDGHFRVVEDEKMYRLTKGETLRDGVIYTPSLYQYIFNKFGITPEALTICRMVALNRVEIHLIKKSKSWTHIKT